MTTALPADVSSVPGLGPGVPTLREQVAAPAISIVIVSWNTCDLLRLCLRSVFDNLGGLSAEVFVVDNGSTDGSADMVASEFPGAILIRNSDNRGFAPANNQAIRQATGRHVLLLNSDTEILGDVLARSVAYLDASPRVAVMGCRVLNPDRTMQATCFQFPSILNVLLKVSGLHRLSYPAFFGREHMRDWKRDTERAVDVVTGCFMLVRSEAITHVGPLDEEFFFCGEETEWCHRFVRAGWSVRFAPVGQIVHIGNGSGSRLSYRRDLLLTRGVLLYFIKTRGIWTARITWCLFWSFVALRAAFWSGVSLISRKPHVGERRNHFAALLVAYPSCYPRKSWVHGDPPRAASVR